MPLRQIAKHPPAGLRSIWRRWLLRSIRKMLQKEGVNQLVCYDIGARWGIWQPFRQLPLPIFKVGFEADSEEARQLVESGKFDSVAPVGLSEKEGQRTLFIARDPGCSSLYGPDVELIAQHGDPKNFTIVREISLKTTTLENAIKTFNLPPPDFIKLDVEGAELEILKGAQNILENCSGIFFEARLAPFYKGEGLFGGVATELINRGYSITSFERLGSFDGAIMLVDVSACRNLHRETRRQHLLKSAAFALLMNNFEFALASLRKVASKRDILWP